MTGAIVSYSGVDTTTPINVENGQATAASTTHSTPSITTTVANCRLVTSFARAGTGTWTPPAGMTERSDSTAQAVALGVDDLLQASAGATGTKTATASVSKVGATHILALKPGGGAVTVNCGGYFTPPQAVCFPGPPGRIYPKNPPPPASGALPDFPPVTGHGPGRDISVSRITPGPSQPTSTTL